MKERDTERKIKMIWDFHGPEAKQTAQHHVLHLKDFIKTNKLQLDITGIEEVNPHYVMAYLVTLESEVPPVRAAVKPQRGQYYEE